VRHALRDDLRPLGVDQKFRGFLNGGQVA